MMGVFAAVERAMVRGAFWRFDARQGQVSEAEATKDIGRRGTRHPAMFEPRSASGRSWRDVASARPSFGGSGLKSQA